MSRYYSMKLAKIAFQACSFNHSDISPSLESTAYEQLRTTIITRSRKLPKCCAMACGFNDLRPDSIRSLVETV